MSASRSLALLVTAFLAGSAASAVAAPQQQEPPPPRIRVAVEIIPVDVQVIDRTGQPVPNLGPEKFTVTINGRRRRVISAEQIKSDRADDAESAAVGSPSAAVPGRVIMLAIDCISFDATASRDVIQSVAQFVRGLLSDDYVGLSAYPNGPQISPTRDHPAILRALDKVVGQRDGPGLSQFTLRPSDVIDISRDIRMGGGPTLDKVVARECGQDPGPTCRFRLITEVTNTALYYEGQATASLGMLRTLLKDMRGFPGRKTLILVSGGLMASDAPGGRPDLGSLGLHVGREAAIANTAVYTLFIDSSFHDRFAAETRRADRSVDNQRRDSTVLVRWLEQFAGEAGGALFNVQVGNAEAALARIHSELSSYYLLGVEPADQDRDGRTHEVSVRLRESNLTIRGRRWVTIPKRGITAAPGATPATSVPDRPEPPPVEATPARVVPPEITALANVFERGNSDALQKALARERDLVPVLRAFRLSDSPWPDNRRRTAIFALELALAGLRSDIRDVREEGGRLLAEYHARIRAPQGADAFECWWLVTEAAALQGLFNPENALLFIPRALQRCASPQLHLAHALVLEQQWVRGTAAAGQDAEIVAAYERAMKFPGTEMEARVRAARFLSGLGQFDRGLALLGMIGKPPADPELRYFMHLVRGQLLRGSGRLDEASSAFRAALDAWPGAQSAQVGLMTLRLAQGNRDEAAALADAVLTAPIDQYDPWWMYWLGDYRVYPAIFDKLRELGQ